MKPTRMASLNLAISIALASLGANAQQNPDQPSSTPPGLYTTVSQSEIYIIQGDSQIDLKVGEAAYAGQDTMQRLDAVPEFLNWPCGSGEDLLPTYPWESLPADNRLEEVARRFFGGPEIPRPIPAWLNSESHGRFSSEEIKRFPGKSYWYESGNTTTKMEALRPKILLISLYPASQQVVVDQNRLQELIEYYGGEDLPVTFIFNRVNVVPISYFGNGVTVQQVTDAYFEEGVSAAEVPMWYAGDRHLMASLVELEQLFDIPAIDDIAPERLAALVADLQANGFSKKPISVLLMSQNKSVGMDEGEKVRAAQSIGIESFPIVFFYYDENSHRKHCGLTLPPVPVDVGTGDSALAPPTAGITPAETQLSREKLASDN